MLNLQDIRTARGMSVRRLSIVSDVSRSYITELEQDVYGNPGTLVVCKLCKALEVTPNELIKSEYWQ